MAATTIDIGGNKLPLRFGVLCIEEFLTLNIGNKSPIRSIAHLIWAALNNQAECTDTPHGMNFNEILSFVDDFWFDKKDEFQEIESKFLESKAYQNIISNSENQKKNH